MSRRKNQSSGPTPRQLLQAAQKQQDQPIQYQYNQDYYESLKPDPKWKNKGEIAWNRARDEWIEDTQEDEPLDRTDYTNDIDTIATCIAKYKSFDEPVPIDLMAEILEITWIEAPTL